MNRNLRLSRLILAMTAYDHGDPMRIQHFMKLLAYASTIATLENLDPETQAVLEAAAVLHDIGIHVSEQKYGSSNGKYQEQEGPAEARRLLATLNAEATAAPLSTPAASTATAVPLSTPPSRSVCASHHRSLPRSVCTATAGRLSTPAPAPLFTPAEIDRICFLIAHHHTYSHIDALDYQILVEADFLVNLYEDYSSPAEAPSPAASSSPATSSSPAASSSSAASSSPASGSATAGRLSTPAPSAFPAVSPKAALAAQSVLAKIFRTETGKQLLRSMFLTPRS